MLALLLVLGASAGAPGYYHPDDIAALSGLYAKASEGSGTVFEERSRKAEGLSRALVDHELALDLLGPSAPPAERERLDAVRRTYNREYAVLEAFATELMEDFDRGFTSAMGRAVAALPYEVSECKARVPMGPPIPRMPQRMVDNQSCQGEDLNASVAAAMDADPILIRVVDGLVTRPWPDLTVDVRKVAVVDGGDPATNGYVHVDALLRAVAGPSLARIDREDEQARLPLEAAIEEGASKEQLAGLVDEGRRITAETARKRAELAAPILAAAAVRTSRVRGPIGWCAQPEILGGCAGLDATAEVVEMLELDRRFTRVLPE